MRLATIDPGVRHCGVAIWEGSALDQAYLAIQPKNAPWLEFLNALPTTGIDLAVIEIPQVYPGSPVRHEVLIQLAAAAGAIAGRLGCPVIQARPAIWTRQTTTDKEIRLVRAWERLSLREQAKVELPKQKIRQADVKDAIALGLWYLKRW